MSQISDKCKTLLLGENIDILSTIDYDVNGQKHSLSFEYIIDTYMRASKESQLVFLSALQKSTDVKEMGVEKFFEGMGQLLLMTHLSSKIEI